MNETIHKALLERPGSPRDGSRPTRQAGLAWSLSSYRTPSCWLRRFDRLTLVAAGLLAPQIVALVGTAVQVEWLPAQVKTVVLALDGDDGGKGPVADLPISLPRRDYEYRSVHWGRRPRAKIGMNSGNTWGKKALHLCLRHCPRHVLPEDGPGCADMHHDC